MGDSRAAQAIGWIARDAGGERAWTPARVARVDELLMAGLADHQLYCATVPLMPGALIAAYSRLRPRAFSQVLVALARHTSGELPYELCDELARFYAAVFARASCRRHRRRALERLLALGPPHRRYAVADVARSVLASARDPADVALVVNVLSRSPWAAWYAHHHTYRHPLDARVAAALSARAALVERRPAECRPAECRRAECRPARAPVRPSGSTP